MGKPPDRVYKYLSSDRARSVLAKLLIRFSQASSLNDALEFKPALKGLGTPEQVRAGVRSRLEVKFPEIYDQIKKQNPPQKANELIEDLVSVAANRVAADNDQRCVKEVYRQLDENFGVLSLSETPSSTLMWSYYADGGRGVLIEFDGEHEWFWAKKDDGDSFRHLRQVGYLERAPEYFLNLSGDQLYTKSVEWSHEKEWRIIRNFNDACEKRGTDSHGTEVLLFAIPPASVKSVVFGYKATEESIQQLKAAVAANPLLSHVTFQRAVQKSDGSVEVVPES